MKFGYSRASATALVRTRVCQGTQFSQLNSQKIRYFEFFSRPKTAALLAVVLPQTFSTFRRRVFPPTLQNLAAATPWKISVKGFPRRVRRTFLKPVFHRWQGREKKTNDPVSRRAMVRGSRGAAAKERKMLALRPYHDASP